MLREGKSSFDCVVRVGVFVHECECMCVFPDYQIWIEIIQISDDARMRPYRVNQVCMILHDLLFPSCFQADAVDSQKLLRWDRKEITSVSWHSVFDVRGEKGGKISPCQFLAALIEVPVGQMTDSRLINASSACRQSKLIGAKVRQLMQLEALIGIGQRLRLPPFLSP